MKRYYFHGRKLGAIGMAGMTYDIFVPFVADNLTDAMRKAHAAGWEVFYPRSAYPVTEASV